MGAVKLLLGWQGPQLEAGLLTESGIKTQPASLTGFGKEMCFLRWSLQLLSNGQAEVTTLWHLINSHQAGLSVTALVCCVPV